VHHQNRTKNPWGNVLDPRQTGWIDENDSI